MFSSLISGGTCGITFWTFGMSNSRSHRSVASPEASETCYPETSRYCVRSFPSGSSTLDRQLRACFRFRVRVPAGVRAAAVHHVRAVRAATQDRAGVGVPGVGGRHAVRARGAVLRRAGLRVRGVRLLHVPALRARHVRVAGRARAPAGRGMTARGPGAPAAAAPPPRVPPRAPAPRPAPPRCPRIAPAALAARALHATSHRHLAATPPRLRDLNLHV